MCVKDEMDVLRLSPYAEKLSGAERKRDITKLELIGHVDPFLLISSGGDTSATFCDLPAVDACDIVSYLVLQTSFLQTNVTVLIVVDCPSSKGGRGSGLMMTDVLV